MEDIPVFASLNLSPGYMFLSVQWRVHFFFLFCFFVCFFFLFFCLSLCVCLCLPLWLTDANTPKKCRALFGLDQLSLWCKPCRYNCCSANGRKTSTMSSFFLLDYDYYYIPLKKNTVSIRVVTDGKLFFSLLRFYRGASCCKTPLAANFFFLHPHWTRFKAQWQKMDFFSKINKYFISTNVSRCKITASPLVSFGITFPYNRTHWNPFSPQAVDNSLPS